MVKTKPTKSPQPKSLHINKRTAANNFKIGLEFKSFFNTIAAKIDERIISASLVFRNIPRKPDENTVFLTVNANHIMPATVNEVESVIKELQDKQVQIVSFLRSLKITKIFSLSHFASLPSCLYV